IMKQPAGLPDVCLRRTVGLPLSIQAAEYIVLTRPLDVVADEKIQQSVTVVVEPQRRRAECLPLAQAARNSDVGECALARILEQAVLANAGYEDVRETIVVVVTDSGSHAIHFDIEPSLAGNVGESPIAIISIELERGALVRVARPIHSVNQQNVLPSIS